MSEVPDWFAELPFVHQVVLLASFGPWIAIVVVAAVVFGGMDASPFVAGGVAFLVGEAPLAMFLYDRYAE